MCCKIMAFPAMAYRAHLQSQEIIFLIFQLKSTSRTEFPNLPSQLSICFWEIGSPCQIYPELPLSAFPTAKERGAKNMQKSLFSRMQN